MKAEDVLKNDAPSFNVNYGGALADVDKGGQTLKSPKPKMGMTCGQTHSLKQRPNLVPREQVCFEEQTLTFGRRSVLCRCKIVTICD